MGGSCGPPVCAYHRTPWAASTGLLSGLFGVALGADGLEVFHVIGATTGLVKDVVHGIGRRDPRERQTGLAECPIARQNKGPDLPPSGPVSALMRALFVCPCHRQEMGQSGGFRFATRAGKDRPAGEGRGA